jgi:hypothetical protein
MLQLLLRTIQYEKICSVAASFLKSLNSPGNNPIRAKDLILVTHRESQSLTSHADFLCFQAIPKEGLTENNSSRHDYVPYFLVRSNQIEPPTNSC